MNDTEVQKKLNDLQRIANELAKEAKKRYGDNGRLFYEAEGQFHFMSHDDSVSGAANRQSGVVMSSRGVTDMDCGAW